MIYCRGLQVAMKITGKLIEILGNDEKMIVESWSNCREQGHYLGYYLKSKAAVYAENRNSDDIVVIISHMDNFVNNHPNEIAYANRKYFDYNDYDGAVAYILEEFGIVDDAVAEGISDGLRI